MALINAVPAQDVISGLRGSLDFYEQWGLAVVRRWPRYEPTSQTQATKAAQQPFAYVHTHTTALPPHVVQSWRWLADQSNLTWRDWMARAYIGGTLAAPGQPWP